MEKKKAFQLKANRRLPIVVCRCMLNMRDLLLRPANEVCEGYVFTPVCHSVHGGGVCPSACWDTPTPEA